AEQAYQGREDGPRFGAVDRFDRCGGVQGRHAGHADSTGPPRKWRCPSSAGRFALTAACNAPRLAPSGVPNMRIILPGCIAILACAGLAPAFADEVFLKGGAKFSGRIES